MIGPRIAPMPMTGPKMPKTWPISSSGKTSLRMPKPWGIMIAANAPWTRRAPISTPVDGASAQSSDVAVKPSRPIWMIRRRPWMSPRRAPVTRPTAYVRA